MARPEREANVEAFEGLVRAHRAEIFRALRRWSDTREEAEDLTQIAFLDAYRALSHGARPGAPRAWLHAIARNAASRRFRKRRLVEIELGPELPAAAEDDLPAFSELKAAFRRLTPNQRCALLLREVGGLSADEIGSVLGVSRGAVETLLFRARRALRAELGDGEEPRRKKRSPLGGLAWLLGSAGRRAAFVGVTAVTGGAVTVGIPSLSASAHSAAATAPARPRVMTPVYVHHVLPLRLPSVVSGSAVVVRSHPVTPRPAPKPAIVQTVAPVDVAPVHVAPVLAASARPSVHASSPPIAAAPSPVQVTSPETSPPAASEPVQPVPAAARAAHDSEAPPASSGSVVDTAQHVVRTVGGQVDSTVQQVTSAAAPVTSALPPPPSALPPPPSVTVPDVGAPQLPSPPPADTPSVPAPPAVTTPSVPLPPVPGVPS